MKTNMVAIIGRPNVGKSTLFNRITEKQQAITSDVSGLTRDRHYGIAEWQRHLFTLIDTGGFVDGDKQEFDKEILQQLHVAIREATVVLFLVDAKIGLTSGDKTLAQMLRKYEKPVVLAANKAEGMKANLDAYAFHELGLGKVYHCSSAHGMGTGDLLDAVTAHFPEPEEEQEGETLTRIALIGQPNAGKSTFLNALLGEERAIVHEQAHTTRDATDSHYRRYGKHFILTDTAGIRKKAQVKDPLEYYAVVRAVRAVQRADVCILLIDALKNITTQDLHLIALATEHKKGVVLVVNKWDAVAKKDEEYKKRYRKDLLARLAHVDYLPIIFAAGLTKKNIYQTVEKALMVGENRKRHVTTSQLNKIMEKAIAMTPPPAVKGKYIQIKYVTQIEASNPTFIFFCNLPQYIKPAYTRFLANKLRQHFDFVGVPLTLFFRQK
jgi:GTP-binding protein